MKTSENEVDDVKVISVVDNEGNTLFAESGVEYEIPIYQRAFAWGTEMEEDPNRQDEVVQLMDDVYEAEGEHYYIGSLVTHKKCEKDRPNVYEVIDGQQRLTALFIILRCLKSRISHASIQCPSTLKFKCRQTSSNAVANIDNIIQSVQGLSNEAVKEKGVWKLGGETEIPLEDSICEAAKRIFEKIDEMEDGYADALLAKLKNVRIYRIVVPDDTDLNRYFEIMNVRGEQLEPADIVKARLMNLLESDEKRMWFAQIWNACSDMNGYVQMHFDSELRTAIFGEKWNGFPAVEAFTSGAVSGQNKSIDGVDEAGASLRSQNILPESSVLSAILHPDTGYSYDAVDEKALKCEDDDARCRSVIYFSHFLLHVLRVFKKSLGGEGLESGQLIVAKMAAAFESALPQEDKKKQAEWAWGYVICLLRCRFVFDKHIIKRDYLYDADRGTWSLLELRKTGERTWKYDDTQGIAEGTVAHKLNLMIQSCLRVSYTDHKTMRWVTVMLDWLYNEYRKSGLVTMQECADRAEAFAKEEARKFFCDLKDANWRLGTRTAHLLFNYLDFLLWRNSVTCGKEEDFVFEFRNSVEHWYPQHPNEENLSAWASGFVVDEGKFRWLADEEIIAIDDGRRRLLDRDQFGNLCIITPSENSTFSNMPPAAKARFSENWNRNGSLKYRRMAAILQKLEARGSDAANLSWRGVSVATGECEKHGREMLQELSKALGVPLQRELDAPTTINLSEQT